MLDPFSIDFKKILSEVKTIAIVGASSKTHRDSHKVMKFLLDKGYKIFPVNPNESGKLILAQRCYDDLESIKKNVDMVDVFRANEAIMDISEKAIKIGAKILWMQEGIMHHEAANLAMTAGLRVVMDRCPKKELIK